MEEITDRKLERAGVERVAANPEWIEPSRARAGVELRFGRIPEAGGKVLRVTTVDETDVRVDLTAHFVRPHAL